MVCGCGRARREEAMTTTKKEESLSRSRGSKSPHSNRRDQLHGAAPIMIVTFQITNLHVKNLT